MSKIRTIIVGTDFSTASRGALVVAAALARAHGARLVIAHAVGSVEYGGSAGVSWKTVLMEIRARAITRLERLARPIRKSGVVVEPAAPEGAPEPALSALALAEGADLLVVGTHGRSGLARFFLGSDAARLARSAPVPLLVVPRIGRGFAIRRVLAGTDFSECAAHALAVGLSITGPFSPEVTVAHAVDLGPIEAEGVTASDIRARAEKRSATLLLKWTRARAGRTARTAVVSGRPAEAISGLATARAADVVALGSVGRSGWQGFFVGNTAERVLRIAKAPVLIVKPEGFAARGRAQKVRSAAR